MDMGDPGHPMNKVGFASRLSRVVLHHVYQKNIAFWSGPLFKSAEISSDGITVTFDQAGGLKVQVWRNRDVAIAGADGKFVWANAQIENELVIVWQTKSPNPKPCTTPTHEIPRATS